MTFSEPRSELKETIGQGKVQRTGGRENERRGSGRRRRAVALLLAAASDDDDARCDFGAR